MKVKLFLLCMCLCAASFGQVKLNNIKKDTATLAPSATIQVKDNKPSAKLRVINNVFGTYVDSNRTGTFNINILGTYSMYQYETVGGSFYSYKFYIIPKKTNQPTVNVCNTDSASLSIVEPGATLIEWYVDSNLVNTLLPTETFTIFNNGSVRARARDNFNQFNWSNQRNINCIVN